jgi:hypothetical protein
MAIQTADKKIKVERCPACGNILLGAGVVRYGKRFCNSWHADQSKPPSLRQRLLCLLNPKDDGKGGACC